MFFSFRVNHIKLYVCTALVLIGSFAALHIKQINEPAFIASTEISNSVDIPIIMYHAISKYSDIQNDYVISPTEFENDLKFLADNGYNTVSVQDIVNYINGNGTLPKKAIVLTFDDGYYNNYLYAFPLLQKYKFKATISPIAYYSDLYTENGEVNEKYTHCTWQQLKEMTSSGLVELGNHTYNLHSNNGCRKGISRLAGESDCQYEEIVGGDIQQAQNLIQTNTGVTCDVFAYPFGVFSTGSENILHNIGFSAVLTCDPGINHLEVGNCEQLYNLKRFIRPHGKGLENKFWE